MTVRRPAFGVSWKKVRAIDMVDDTDFHARLEHSTGLKSSLSVRQQSKKVLTSVRMAQNRAILTPVRF
jgi:hypothetical protein